MWQQWAGRRNDPSFVYCKCESMHSLICNIKSLDLKISVKPDCSKVRKNAWDKKKNPTTIPYQSPNFLLKRRKERKRETGALGKFSWRSLSRPEKYKMLWATNSSQLHFQTSCLRSYGQSWVFTQQGKRTWDHGALVRGPPSLTATTSDKMKSWKSSFEGARWNKRMLCGCSSWSYPHVRHLFLIIPTSSLCQPSLSLLCQCFVFQLLVSHSNNLTLKHFKHSNSTVLATPLVWLKQISVVDIKYSHEQAKLGMFGKLRIWFNKNCSNSFLFFFWEGRDLGRR